MKKLTYAYLLLLLISTLQQKANAQTLSNKLSSNRGSTKAQQIGIGDTSTKIIMRCYNIVPKDAPLWIIDGVIAKDMSMLNPNDIESIDVLKDSAACAIYGAR